MDWKLIDEFERLLDVSGNATLEEGEPRKQLTAWALKREVKLVFHDPKEGYENQEHEVFIWVGVSDLRKLIEFLQSGQRNNVETNEELKHLIQELWDIHTWLSNYPRTIEKE